MGDGPGLGRMGYRMASNLRKKTPKETPLYINDLNLETCKMFAEEHANFGPVHIVKSAKEAATQAKVLISVVTASPHVRSLYLDDQTGIILAPKDPDRIMLECSTIDLTTTRDVERELSEARIGTYVDAPISGGIKRAGEGTLAFMIGHPGNPDSDPVAQRIYNIVKTMAHEDRITFCGTFSTGLAAKIANNYAACNNMVILAEAFAMGMANGVDRKVLFECMRNSSGASWALEYAQPVPGIVPGPASNKYEVSFLIPMIIKDMALGVDLAKLGDTPAQMGETSLKIFEAADKDPRCKNLDCTSVWLHLSDCRFDPEFQK
ncbi:uncharacterized protein A1O5_10769 [Cladophialophora psammophila CBS 110553]|uniref:3-hydroxyisobutyrate dehydrogenase n=1 Tax=Cladophialophora psammophila CBS 110553 TaxID=1182543 RepID=W9WDX9_9EURO|nr:uncharacterized protein A1O5_10769 [Cladophialophora psammophila CBS 110553]EXJ66153.1 hypothetical protein A1O5_10769 [Cladophialophora psammophila CBS 110553]